MPAQPSLFPKGSFVHVPDAELDLDVPLEAGHDPSRGLRLLLDSTAEGIYRIDRAGRCTFVNRAAARMLGYEPGELIGRSLHELIHHSHPDGSPYPAERCPIDRTTREGRGCRVEDEVLWRRDGSPLLVSYASYPIMQGSEIRGAAVTFADITERKLMESRLHETIRSVELLRAVADAVNETSSVREALRMALELVCLHTGWPVGHIYRVSHEPRQAVATDIWWLADPVRFAPFRARTEATRFEPGTELPGTVLTSGKPLWVDDVTRLDGFARVREAGEAGLRAACAFPVLVGEAVVAVLECFSTEVMEPDAQLLELMAQVGTTLGRVVERARAQEALRRAHGELADRIAELEQRARETTLISQLGDTLQSCVTFEEAYDAIAQFARRLFPEQSGGLFLLDPRDHVLEAVATWGEAPPSQRVFESNDCWALRRGRIHEVDSPEEPVCAHVEGRPSRYACVPMMAQGETLGVFHLGGSDEQGPTTRQLVVTVAEHVALAVANFRLREILRDQSIRDPLTGLFNRRFMEETLGRELIRAARSGAPLGLIAIDIDHFKVLNDTSGHQAGDAVLRTLGEFLRTHVRGGDVACRYGGEEFTVIMPGADLEITRQRAESLREGFARMDLPPGTTSGITISAGAAAFPDHGSTPEQLMRAADVAMYRAKAQGRNRVEVAGSA